MLLANQKNPLWCLLVPGPTEIKTETKTETGLSANLVHGMTPKSQEEHVVVLVASLGYEGGGWGKGKGKWGKPAKGNSKGKHKKKPNLCQSPGWSAKNEK